MPRSSGAPSHEILQAALDGLEAQRKKLDEQIAEVRRMLGSRAGRSAKSSAQSQTLAKTGRKRKPLTAEARKRIAAAQKKRWAAFRKTQS